MSASPAPGQFLGEQPRFPFPWTLLWIAFRTTPERRCSLLSCTCPPHPADGSLQRSVGSITATSARMAPLDHHNHDTQSREESHMPLDALRLHHCRAARACSPRYRSPAAQHPRRAADSQRQGRLPLDPRPGRLPLPDRRPAARLVLGPPPSPSSTATASTIRAARCSAATSSINGVDHHGQAHDYDRWPDGRRRLRPGTTCCPTSSGMRTIGAGAGAFDLRGPGGGSAHRAGARPLGDPRRLPGATAEAGIPQVDDFEPRRR